MLLSTLRNNSLRLETYWPYFTGKEAEIAIFLLDFCPVVLVVAGFPGYHCGRVVGFQDYCKAVEGGTEIGQVKTIQGMLF